MKTEKQIQDEVWKHISKDERLQQIWSVVEYQHDIQNIIKQAVAKAIELTRPTIGIIRHEKIDVDGYKCGYEAALKELKSNVLKDSTAAIIHKNGYDEGYATGYRAGCFNFAHKMQKELTKT